MIPARQGKEKPRGAVCSISLNDARAADGDDRVISVLQHSQSSHLPSRAEEGNGNIRRLRREKEQG